MGEKYDPDDKTASGRALVDMWDDWQQQMKCCGVESYKDWAERNPFFDPDQQNNVQILEMKSGYSNTMSVPESCCDPSKSQGNCEPISSRGIYLTGCFQKMIDQIDENSAIVGGVAIGIIVVMNVPLILVAQSLQMK